MDEKILKDLYLSYNDFSEQRVGNIIYEDTNHENAYVFYITDGESIWIGSFIIEDGILRIIREARYGQEILGEPDNSDYNR